MASKDYASQVFINCPFDDAYLEMYRACIFAILDAGFIPRCSKEVNNGTTIRLDSILKLIEECHYGIHDLSRVQPDPKSRLPRFNMPFELGIFYSSKYFGTGVQKHKCCLILEKDSFRYQKFISDISGIDVTPHNNSPKKLIVAIRQWLYTSSQRTSIPQGREIYKRFMQFNFKIKSTCKSNNVEFNDMPFIELVDNMTDWLLANQKSPTLLV